MTKFKVIHDTKECMGCGACASVCPEYFELKEDSGFKAHLKGAKDDNGKEVLETDDIDSIKEASNVCPASCIKIEKNK